MTRQEYNKKILSILKKSDNTSIKMIIELFGNCIEKYPDQRAGQIFCNYICSDYRDGEGHVCKNTKDILNFLFPNNPDPFFEESKETYERLKKLH